MDAEIMGTRVVTLTTSIWIRCHRLCCFTNGSHKLYLHWGQCQMEPTGATRLEIVFNPFISALFRQCTILPFLFRKKSHLDKAQPLCLNSAWYLSVCLKKTPLYFMAPEMSPIKLTPWSLTDEKMFSINDATIGKQLKPALFSYANPLSSRYFAKASATLLSVKPKCKCNKDDKIFTTRQSIDHIVSYVWQRDSSTTPCIQRTQRGTVTSMDTGTDMHNKTDAAAKTNIQLQTPAIPYILP